MRIFNLLANWPDRVVDGIERLIDGIENAIDRFGDLIDRGLDRLDEVTDGIRTPSSCGLVTPDIREKLAGMRVLLLGGHPEAPLAEINDALTKAGLQVCWERHDMHLIPKQFDLLGLRADSLLVNNTHIFDVVIIDWRKPPSYEWGWCPASVFMKFGKRTLKIGIGPADKRDEQLGNGAEMFFDYGKFLGEDLDTLLFILAATTHVEDETAATAA